MIQTKLLKHHGSLVVSTAWYKDFLQNSASSTRADPDTFLTSKKKKRILIFQLLKMGRQAKKQNKKTFTFCRVGGTTNYKCLKKQYSVKPICQGGTCSFCSPWIRQRSGNKVSMFNHTPLPINPLEILNLCRTVLHPAWNHIPLVPLSPVSEACNTCTCMYIFTHFKLLWLCLSSFTGVETGFNTHCKRLSKCLSRVVAFIIDLSVSRVWVERKALSLRSCNAQFDP